MTTQINLTQLRDYLERIQPKQVTLRRAEVLALLDTAEAANELLRVSDEERRIDFRRLRETLGRFET